MRSLALQDIALLLEIISRKAFGSLLVLCGLRSRDKSLQTFYGRYSLVRNDLALGMEHRFPQLH